MLVNIQEQAKLEKRDAFYKSIGLDRLGMRKNILNIISKPIQDVLEVGTGKGVLTKVLAKESTHVTSVDLSTEEQELARQLLIQEKLLDKVTLLIADAEKLPFAELSFDTVVCAYSFHHFKDPFRAIDEMVRVFTNRFVLVEFNDQGFNAVNKAHELEGDIHEQNGVDFLTVKSYLENKSLNVRYISDQWQHIFIVTRKVKGGVA